MSSILDQRNSGPRKAKFYYVGRTTNGEVDLHGKHNGHLRQLLTDEIDNARKSGYEPTHLGLAGDCSLWLAKLTSRSKR